MACMRLSQFCHPEDGDSVFSKALEHMFSDLNSTSHAHLKHVVNKAVIGFVS
jgi:hypothetical protein